MATRNYIKLAFQLILTHHIMCPYTIHPVLPAHCVTYPNTLFPIIIKIQSPSVDNPTS